MFTTNDFCTWKEFGTAVYIFNCQHKKLRNSEPKMKKPLLVNCKETKNKEFVVNDLKIVKQIAINDLFVYVIKQLKNVLKFTIQLSSSHLFLQNHKRKWE